MSANAAIAKVAEWPYEFELAEVNDTWIDRRYQRDLKPIKTEFNPALVGTVVASDRSNRGKRLSIIDGQRRRDLVKREGLAVVPCVVFYDLTVEAEAELFALLQKERKGITPYERFRAELTAGHRTALAINAIVHEEGFELAPQEPDMRHIKAITGVERIYGRDPELLRNTLRLIAHTWEGVWGASREKMLSGVALFLEETGDLDWDKFVRRLRDVTPSTLDVRATQLRDSKGLRGSSPKFLAEVIRTQYRRNR